MNMLRLILFSALLAFSAQAQQDSLYQYEPGFGFGFGGGLKGLTAQVSYHFQEHWNLRAEVNGLRVEDLTVDISFSGQTLRTVGNLDVFITGLALDFFPAPQKSSFHLFAGLSYAVNNRMQGRGLYPEAVAYGDITFEGEEIGYVDVQLQPARLMPQMGIAFGRPRPKRSVGVRLEIGTYYWGAPRVNMEATRMLENTAQEAEKLEENLEQYRWWPFMNLSLNFRL